MLSWLKRIALLVPPIRRVVSQRNRSRLEAYALLHERNTLLDERNILLGKVREAQRGAPADSGISEHVALHDYSQNGEQNIILEYFYKNTSPYEKFCVDAGAFDGLIGSNSRALFLRGWRGIAIEPNPRSFARLQSLYSHRPDVQCLQVAVSNRSEHSVSMLFAVGPRGTAEEDKWIYSQLSTLDRAWAEQQRRQLGFQYELSTVDVQTLTEILGNHSAPREIGFVTIDCEGEDLKIVRELDFSLFQPQLICIEYNDEPTRQLYMQYLESKGYRYHASTVSNIFFERIER